MYSRGLEHKHSCGPEPAGELHHAPPPPPVEDVFGAGASHLQAPRWHRPRVLDIAPSMARPTQVPVMTRGAPPPSRRFHQAALRNIWKWRTSRLLRRMDSWQEYPKQPQVWNLVEGAESKIQHRCGSVAKRSGVWKQKQNWQGQVREEAFGWRRRVDGCHVAGSLGRCVIR